jgi:hypothetical protein
LIENFTIGAPVAVAIHGTRGEASYPALLPWRSVQGSAPSARPFQRFHDRAGIAIIQSGTLMKGRPVALWLRSAFVNVDWETVSTTSLDDSYQFYLPSSMGFCGTTASNRGAAFLILQSIANDVKAEK